MADINLPSTLSASDWIEAVEKLGFGHAIGLLIIFSACCAIIGLVYKADKILKVTFDYSISRRKLDADTEFKKRQFEHTLKQKIERRKSPKGKSP